MLGSRLCGPEDPLFTPLLPLARVPFQARVSSQDPLLRKFGNFSLYSLNFHPNFSSQAPTFGIFQLTSPQIGKFSAHKPPNWEIFRSQAPLFRGKCQFASPTLRKSGPHTPTWKKVECPPPRGLVIWLSTNIGLIAIKNDTLSLFCFVFLWSCTSLAQFLTPFPHMHTVNTLTNLHVTLKSLECITILVVTLQT